MSGTLDGISAALDEVFKEIREKVREAGKEAKMWESLQAFAAAVDWTVCVNLCYHSDCRLQRMHLCMHALGSYFHIGPASCDVSIMEWYCRNHGSLACLQLTCCSLP